MNPEEPREPICQPLSHRPIAARHQKLDFKAKNHRCSIEAASAPLQVHETFPGAAAWVRRQQKALLAADGLLEGLPLHGFDFGTAPS